MQSPMSAHGQFLLSKMLEWLEQGRSVALATVIQTWGSAPQPAGSQLLVDADGNFLGSVSGGCVEAEVITEAAEVIATGAPKSLEFGVGDDVAWKAGLACGGAIRVFVEQVGQGTGAPEMFQALLGDVGARRPSALVTNLATGERVLIHSPDDLGRDLAAVVEQAFGSGSPAALATSGGELFVNMFNPTIRLVIVGAVHISQEIVPMARAVGHDLVIVDPRPGFATEERFPDIPILREWPDEALPRIGLDHRTAVVALTHDPKLDDPALILAVSSQAFYVGALGSRKTHAKRVERLLQSGLSAADVERICAPIGLDIGATGAAEIALSIVAEITAAQRGKSGR